jgi:DNA-directed RNA polymerase specialized sigma subunit
MEKILGVLGPKERRIIESYFMHKTPSGIIGKSLGVSKQRISYIMKDALIKTRKENRHRNYFDY